MSIRHYYRSVRLLVSLWVGCCGVIEAKNEPCLLKSVQLHQGGTLNTAQLELGTAVLFFSAPVIPLVLSKRETKQGIIEQRMLFTGATTRDDQVSKMMVRINNQKGEGYQIQCREVQGPVKGIEFTIMYDKNAVAFTYEKTVSSSSLPGYIFRFIDQSLYMQLAKKVQEKGVTHTALKKRKPRVVIDPGHGGHDGGAIGCGQVQEKMITLSISKKIRDYLHPLCDTLLTRMADNFLQLDERTAVANKKQADLFVSVHANAAPNRHAVGIETFFYPCALTSLLGASEKFKSSSFRELYFKKKMDESMLLSESIQEAVCKEVYPFHKFSDKINRKIKKAPFQVLIGTAQPSALVEVGFLTHAYEATLLVSEFYQKKIAEGIARGILSYLRREFYLG